MAQPTTLEEFRAGAARGRILALLLVGVLLAAGLTLAIIYRHDSFATTSEIYFDTDSASGLPVGTAVTMSGFRVGQVSAVALQPDFTVRVTLSLRAEYRPGLREDTSAELLKEDLLKPAVIAIDRGKSERTLVKPQIVFSRPESFADMAAEIKSRVAPILDDVKQITGTLRQRQEHLGAIMEEAANATRELAHAAKEVNALSADVRRQVSAIGVQSVSAFTEANQTVIRLNGVISQAEKSVATINKSLPQLVQDANTTLESVQGVARDARIISQAAAETLPGTLRSVQPAAEEAREVMRGVTQAWPIRDLLAPPPPPALSIDSHDARALRAPAAR